MASLKALKIRIASVKSTQKITKAMKMVAAAKLRRAQAAAEAGRPYAERLATVMSSLASKVTIGPESPKLLAGTGKDQVHLLVVATSERGLAGAFNTNIVRAARKAADELIRQGKTVRFYLIGKKGRPVIARLFPGMIVHQVDQTHEAGGVSAVVEYEPDEETILAELLPRNVAIQLFRAFLENAASEQGSRMTAMDNATRNAGDMINKLTIQYNRTRQAAITTELVEIISGAEAL